MLFLQYNIILWWKKDVFILTGTGQIGMAIARRVGYGKKIIVADKSAENADIICSIMECSGFDVEPVPIFLLTV